jgi:hypothetical protein
MGKNAGAMSWKNAKTRHDFVMARIPKFRSEGFDA